MVIIRGSILILLLKDDPAGDPARRVFNSTGSLPENWYSVEMEVNSNGNIIDGVNHCYAFGIVNDEIIFSDDDFPCPTFSNSYGNITYSDELPSLGGYIFGGSINGTVQIGQFEWLEGVTPTATTTTTTTTTTIGETLRTEKQVFQMSNYILI